MTINEELEKVKNDRECDTEWLTKYKRIVDGLQQIAEIHVDTCDNDIDAWASVYHGLNTLSDLIKDDINERKEDAQ